MTSYQPDRMDQIESLLRESIAASEKSSHILSNRIDRIEALVEKNAGGIEQNVESIKQLQLDIKAWDEKFVQFARDNLNLSKTIIFTAGATIIFAPVLQALIPTIKAIVNSFLEP